MKRRCKSALGKYLVPIVHKFLLDNAEHIESDNNVNINITMTDLANAIEFGWANIMSSPIMQSAFYAGIAPPPIPPSVVTPGGPVGIMIYNAIKVQCNE